MALNSPDGCGLWLHEGRELEFWVFAHGYARLCRPALRKGEEGAKKSLPRVILSPPRSWGGGEGSQQLSSLFSAWRGTAEMLRFAQHDRSQIFHTFEAFPQDSAAEPRA